MDDLAETSLLPLLLTTLAALLLGFAWHRSGLDAAHLGHGAAWGRRRWGRGATTIVYAVSFAASAPLFASLPGMLAAAPLLPGDSAPHARVAFELASLGVDRGWITSYNGGFPFGPHYQPAALLTSAALIRLGLGPASATMALGALCVALVPTAFVAAARRAGARPGAALAGALLTAWVNPAHLYMGGPWVVLSEGLVSQAVATLLLLVAAWCVAGGLPSWFAPLCGAAVAATHAQLMVCGLLVGAAAAAFVGSSARRRYAAVGAGAVVTSVALYGPGLATMTLPFGWPDVPEFRVAGFPPSRFVGWLIEGQLLDVGRAPVLTLAGWFSAVVLLLTARTRASRIAGALLGATILVVLSGTFVSGLGVVGQQIVGVFSPVRMLCLVPLATAAAVTVAFTEISARLGQVARGRPRAWWLVSRPAELAIVATFLFSTGPAALARVEQRLAALDTARAGRCRSLGWAGFDGSELSATLRALPQGRFAVHQSTLTIPCPVMAGIELEPRIPVGLSQGGPGTQVGILAEAFEALRADRPGGGSRAEALGVRALLHPRAMSPEPAGAWRTLAHDADVVLSERVGGSGEVGIGCVRAVWRGRTDALRRALFHDFKASETRTLEPDSFVRLEPSRTALSREQLPADDCRPKDATLRVVHHDAASWTARVENPTAVVLVIRATYGPFWSVTVDGRRVAPQLLAPGFPGVELPPGHHVVAAAVGVPAWYPWELALAGMLLLLLAYAYGRDRRFATGGGACLPRGRNPHAAGLLPHSTALARARHGSS